MAHETASTTTTASSPALPRPDHAPPPPSRDPRIRRALSSAPNEDLSISEVSELLGITAHTARYYERAGLLEVSRTPSGHRTYDQKTVERLDFLVRMRTSGMGISELGRYVDLVRAGDVTRPQRLQIMLDQRVRIKAQLQELELALTTTEYKIAKYGGTPNTKDDTHHTQGAPS